MMSVANAGKSLRSATKPTAHANPPINMMYKLYFRAVASDLNVHLALTKNENVTAQPKAIRFEVDWLALNTFKSVRNITQ